MQVSHSQPVERKSGISLTFSGVICPPPAPAPAPRCLIREASRGLKHVMKIVPPNSARSLTARLVFSYLKITPARSDPLSLRPCNNVRAVYDLRHFVPPMAILTHVGLIVGHVGRISFRNISPRKHVSACCGRREKKIARTVPVIRR